MTERIVWVTGGSAGIGASICQRLLDAGCRVVSFARRRPEIVSDRLHYYEVDLMDADATGSAVADAALQYPTTEIVHNAGAILEKPLEDVQPEDLARLTQLHIGAAITLVQTALPTMREKRYGRIVLMSTRAVVGLEKRTVYSATKAGMIGMARTWALELAGDGITVNVVAPGPIAATEMFHDVIPKNSAQLDVVARRIPVGRLGQPSDVARVVEFFLSPDAGFLTGQTLFVCGGTSVGGVTFT